MKLRTLWMLAAAAAISPVAAHAADHPWQIAQNYANKVNSGAVANSPGLSLDPTKWLNKSAEEVSSGDADRSVLTLHEGVGSKIHGFVDMRIASSYITPRGLVAVDKSPQFQTVAGLVFDLYRGDGFINAVSVVGGIWADLNPHPDATVVTGADIVSEVDIFAGFNVKFAKNWEFAYTIQAWTFPDLSSDAEEINPETEYNMDFKFSFDDTEFLGDFAMHPYVDIFWNFCGDSSPVVAQATAQGVNENTFYVEFGVAPSYTFKGIADLPITFTLPAYVQIGDPEFWGESSSGDTSVLGVASIGLKISAPLTFIPKDFGNWNAYVGVTYIHTCNPALTEINSGATGGDANLILGYAGIGFGW